MAQSQERRVKMKRSVKYPQAEAALLLFFCFLLVLRITGRRVLALFPVVVVVERVFPTAAKGWASPVVPASTSAPSGASPTVDSNPPPVDEPGPADCAHRPPLGSSVRCAQGYSAVGYRHPQLLLVETIAMLMRIPQAIRRADFSQRITRTTCGSMTD